MLPLGAGPLLTEMIADAGYDFVVFDCEHGPRDEGTLAVHLALAGARGVHALVRIHRDELGTASRLLDLGAHGLMVPRVDSRAFAEEVVTAVHYPPTGQRGFASGSAAGRYGRSSTAQTHEHGDATFVIAMLEDEAGVQHADAIASTPGIDAVFVGEADLGISLGEMGTGAGSRVAAMTEAAESAAERRVPVLRTPSRQQRPSAGTAPPFVLHNGLALLRRAFEPPLDATA